MPVLPRRHLHTLKIERVLLATLQIVHVKSADDLLPLDHIAGVDRSLPCARFQANRRCFRVLGIRSAGTARKTSRGANQADGCHHEVTTIEVLSSLVLHAEPAHVVYESDESGPRLCEVARRKPRSACAAIGGVCLIPITRSAAMAPTRTTGDDIRSFNFIVSF